MGRAKALLPLAGKSLLAHAIESFVAVESIDPVVVVTGHAAEALDGVLDVYPVRRAHNRAYDAGGMISSVKAGVAAAAGDGADAVFVSLVDHPMVRPDTLRRMISAYRARRPRVLVPAHGGKRGHPILLCARGIGEILALPAGATLKTYTAAHAQQNFELEVDDPAVLQDLDTPADYAAAVRALERSAAAAAAGVAAGVAAAVTQHRHEQQSLEQRPLDSGSEACPSQHVVVPLGT